MNKLNISKCLNRKRREKGITQEELAKYIGVSKASVSKWETGQSYPDILFLPELATYFNVTIDELIGYTPQLTKEDIQKYYHQFSIDFNKKPYNNLKQEINETIKKYYSCFPFLTAISQWLLNYANIAKTEEIKKEMLIKAMELINRVREEADDMAIIRNANALQSVLYLMEGEYDEIIDLLKDLLVPYSGDDLCLLLAYQQKGDMSNAIKANQVMLYQHIIALISLLNNYLYININDLQQAKKIYEQGKALIELFDMKKVVTNAIFSIHITAAICFMNYNQTDMALEAIEEYGNIISGYDLPLTLKGNSQFHLVDKWLKENIIVGTAPVLDGNTTKTNFIKILEENPVFVPLKENARFMKVVDKIKSKEVYDHD